MFIFLKIEICSILKQRASYSTNEDTLYFSLKNALLKPKKVVYSYTTMTSIADSSMAVHVYVYIDNQFV